MKSGIAALLVALSMTSAARAYTISPDEIRRVVRMHAVDARRCYQRALARHPGLTVGRLSLTFVIGPSGAVSAVAVHTATPRTPDLENCLTKRIRRWRFPPPLGGGAVTVTYPFNFQTSP